MRSGSGAGEWWSPTGDGRGALQGYGCGMKSGGYGAGGGEGCGAQHGNSGYSNNDGDGFGQGGRILEAADIVLMPDVMAGLALRYR